MKKFTAFLILAALTFNANTLHSQTTIPDGTSVSGTWDIAGSPYIVEGEAIIPEGLVLTIKPGVEVRLKTGTNFNYGSNGFDAGMLWVDGILIAEGNADSTIIFTKGDTINSYWGVIFFSFKYKYQTSKLKYCDISHGNKVNSVYSSFNAYGAITYGNYVKAIHIEKCTIHHNGHSGIYTSSTSNNPIRIELCHINNNIENGIYCFNAGDVFIQGNIITKNNNGFFAQSGGDFFIHSNTIVKNSNYGIYHSGVSEILNSIVYENGSNFYIHNSLGSSLKNALTDYLPARLLDLGNNIFGIAPHLEVETFKLMKNSPCINNGTHDTTGLLLGAYDLYGNNRIIENIVDIGAHEYSGGHVWLTAPNGPVGLKNESEYSISWIGNIEMVDLYYCLDSGYEWFPIAEEITGLNNYLWNTPDGISDSCYIKIVKSNDESIFDLSDINMELKPYSSVPAGSWVEGIWKSEWSPYQIWGEVVIKTGSSLKIEPGSEIKLKTGTNNNEKGSLIADGLLKAEGTPDSLIYFTRIDSIGNWGSVVLGGSDTSIIRYCNLQYGSRYISSKATYYQGVLSCKHAKFKIIENCIISNGLEHGIYLGEGSNWPLIKNCVIKNNALDGIFVAGNTNPEIINNSVSNNRYGIYCADESEGIISYNILTKNSSGIRTYNWCKSDISDNLIIDNTNNGIWASYPDGTGFRRNIVMQNHNYGVYSYGGNINYFNNIIIKNGSAGIYSKFSYVYLENNTISNNMGPAVENVNSSNSFINCIISYNEPIQSSGMLYFENTVLNEPVFPGGSFDKGGNLLATYPQFTDTTNIDFTLLPTSPCINTGSFNTSILDSTDLAGNPRLSHGRVDMGAYECQQSGEWLYMVYPNWKEVLEGGTSDTIRWIGSEGISNVKIEYSPDNGDGWETISASTSNDGEFIWNNIPALDICAAKIRISDVNSSGISDESDNTFFIASNLIANGEQVSGTWTLANSPYTVEAKAIVPEGQTLTIEPGVEVLFKTGRNYYYSQSHFNMGTLKVEGKLVAEGTEENPINFTRLCDDGLWGVVFFESTADPGSIVKYCNFEYCNAVLFNDIFFGAISFNASQAKIENCTFTTCFTGVVSAYGSSPTLVNNHFAFNYEGGVLCFQSSNTKIINNEFYGNLFYGIHCFQSSPAIINNTITFDGNQVRQTLHNRIVNEESAMLFNPENRNFVYGIYLQDESDSEIQNTIIYGNGIYEEGENIHLEGGSNPTISYSLLSNETLPAGAIDGGNNIFDQNPKFNDPTKLDFSLNAASPCINSGNPDTANFNLPEFDLAGNPRIYENGSIDMGAYEFQAMVQRMELATGWSGLSSWINPQESDMEVLFDPIINNLIILQNEAGMFWPGQNINTLGNWNTHEGYQIKINDSVKLAIAGSRESNQTLPLADNWNLIPVLSECSVDVENLFSGTDIIIAKEVAGWNVYWPAFGINSLEILEPGRAYFVMMENEGELTFPECTPIPTFPLKGEGADPGSNHQHDQRGTQYKNSKVQRNVAAMRAGTPSPQGEVKKTATTHTIALPKEALTNLSLPIGSLIKTYDLSGNCFGAGLWQIENTSITLFGDDPLTNVKDGFYENDQILLELISNDDAISLQVEYDLQQPNADGLFHTNGLSAIKTIELGSTGLDNLSQSSFDVFPNPADEVLNITKNFEGKAGLSIINIQGKIVFVSEFDGMSFELDIKNLQAGIYFIELKSEQANVVKKVVVE